MWKKIEAWFRWPWTIANIYNVVEERPQFVVFRLKYVTLYFISITWTALCLQKKDIVQKWPKTSDYLKLWCGMIYFDRRLAVLSLLVYNYCTKKTKPTLQCTWLYHDVSARLTLNNKSMEPHLRSGVACKTPMHHH